MRLSSTSPFPERGGERGQVLRGRLIKVCLLWGYLGTMFGGGETDGGGGECGMIEGKESGGKENRMEKKRSLEKEAKKCK